MLFVGMAAGVINRTFWGLALLVACGAQESLHYVPACGSCGTAESAAEEAAREHKSLAEQADAAASAARGAAKALGLSTHAQAQEAGKAAFDVYLKAERSPDECSVEAAKEAARSAKANGLDTAAQLNAGAVTAALSLASIGKTGQEQADGAFKASKVLVRQLLPGSQQQEALKALNGPISYITGVLPTGQWNPGPGSLATPASPDPVADTGPAVVPVEEVVMNINSNYSETHLKERGLADWAWFLISFVVAVVLMCAFAVCYRNMSDSEGNFTDEDEEDDLE
eukprot:s2668_g7.t1